MKPYPWAQIQAIKQMSIDSISMMTRREFHRLALAGTASLLHPLCSRALATEVASFVHPGILHTATDLNRMRDGVRNGRSPVAAGYERLRADRFSQSTYKPHTFAEEIGRNPSVNFPAFDDDCNAAYQCSLMAAISGEKRYLQVARSILLGWSGSLQRVSGADAVLMAGLGPFKWINAAEILRGVGELDGAAVAQCAAMLRRAILPAIIDFAPFANGNWDTAAIKTMLAIAVFCEDRALFERALLYALHGDGDGRLTHYIYENGQCQESGRDQQHTQLGLAHLGDACQIAWNQGLDLYGAVEDRLLRGFEYTAAYNLGDRVEFHPDIDRTGKYRHQVISPRSALRPVYEQIFAHYNVRRGLSTPAVARAVAKLRPEGAAQGADHTGFGTLLYALDGSDMRTDAVSAAPAALFVCPDEKGILLEWLRPREEFGFMIDRATGDGPFKTIASGVTDASYLDASVHVARHYRYRVSSRTASFQAICNPVDVFDALPKGWTHHGLGSPNPPGSVLFDGQVLTITASGAGFMDISEEGQFVCAPHAARSLLVRLLPGTASQYAQFGLACRSSLATNAPCTFFILFPSSGNRERAGWSLRLFARGTDGKISVIADQSLGPPCQEYGRMMKPVWLRLERRKTLLIASYCFAGKTWNQVGSSSEAAHDRMGIVASSGIRNVDAAIRLDSIATDSVSLSSERDKSGKPQSSN